MQERTDTMWLLLSIPRRHKYRNFGATWNVDDSLSPTINRILFSSSLVHPQGPALILDNDGISDGAWWVLIHVQETLSRTAMLSSRIRPSLQIVCRQCGALKMGIMLIR